MLENRHVNPALPDWLYTFVWRSDYGGIDGNWQFESRVSQGPFSVLVKACLRKSTRLHPAKSFLRVAIWFWIVATQAVLYPLVQDFIAVLAVNKTTFQILSGFR